MAVQRWDLRTGSAKGNVPSYVYTRCRRLWRVDQVSEGHLVEPTFSTDRRLERARLLKNMA
jgi:hypothetical protein